MIADFSARRIVRNNILDAAGIGHDVEDRFRALHEAVANTAGDFIQRASSQGTYDLMTNVPCGVLTNEQATPEHAIRYALVTTISKTINYDIIEAVRFAAELLQDVNEHGEAARLFKRANEMEQQLDKETTHA